MALFKLERGYCHRWSVAVHEKVYMPGTAAEHLLFIGLNICQPEKQALHLSCQYGQNQMLDYGLT